jgi:hypothetical protein
LETLGASNEVHSLLFQNPKTTEEAHPAVKPIGPDDFGEEIASNGTAMGVPFFSQPNV